MDIEMKGQINLSHAQPYKIELTRGQKGFYGWTVTVHAASVEEALGQLAQCDEALIRTYATQPPTTE